MYDTSSNYNNIHIEIKFDIIADIEKILLIRELPIKIRKYILGVLSKFAMENEFISENTNYYLNNIIEFNNSSYQTSKFLKNIKYNIFNISERHLVDWDSMCKLLINELDYIKTFTQGLNAQKIELKKYFSLILDKSYRLISLKKIDNFDQNYPFGNHLQLFYELLLSLSQTKLLLLTTGFLSSVFTDKYDMIEEVAELQKVIDNLLDTQYEIFNYKKNKDNFDFLFKKSLFAIWKNNEPRKEKKFDLDNSDIDFVLKKLITNAERL